MTARARSASRWLLGPLPSRKGANFTAAMAFEMASTNLVLELSIIKRRHQLRRRGAFILTELIVLPILSIYRAALRI